MDQVVRAGLLLLVLLTVSCAQAEHSCSDADGENRLPFTGKWQHQGENRALCLNQTAPDKVVGTLKGGTAAGQIQSDGTLYLAVTANDQVELYRASLLADTLTLESMVTSQTDGSPLIGVGQLFRKSGS